MNIDWSKAPEGCTHHKVNADFCWYKSDGEDVYWFHHFSGRWLACPLEVSSVNEENGYISRPAEPAWNGEGLPPVGTVCEVLWNESRLEYLRTKVFGVNEHGQPIHRFDEGPKQYQYQADALVTCAGNKVFRPLRTPEQIAAEERVKAIKAMAEILPAGLAPNPESLCSVLYDAGYRKVEVKP